MPYGFRQVIFCKSWNATFLAIEANPRISLSCCPMYITAPRCVSSWPLFESTERKMRTYFRSSSVLSLVTSRRSRSYSVTGEVLQR